MVRQRVVRPCGAPRYLASVLGMRLLTFETAYLPLGGVGWRICLHGGLHASTLKRCAGAGLAQSSMDAASTSVSRACHLINPSLAGCARLWVLTRCFAGRAGATASVWSTWPRSAQPTGSRLLRRCAGACTQRAARPSGKLGSSPCRGCLLSAATQLRRPGRTATRYAANSDLQQNGALAELTCQRCCWDGLHWVLVEGLTGCAPA